MLVKILKAYIESKAIYHLLAWDIPTTFSKIIGKLNLDMLLFIALIQFSLNFKTQWGKGNKHAILLVLSKYFYVNQNQKKYSS